MPGGGWTALHRPATGLSAACDCGISDHTHLLFLVQLSAQWDRKNIFKMKLLSLFHKKYNQIQPISFSYNGLNSHDSIMFQSLDPLLNSFV